MSLSELLKNALGNFRNNKSAAFIHGLRVLGTAIGAALLILSVLTYLDVIRPLQLLQAIGYALALFILDYALVSDLAFGLRFIVLDLFGFLSLSTLITGVTAIGSLSIAWRWYRSQ